MTTAQKFGKGWIPDIPDHRDYKYSAGFFKRTFTAAITHNEKKLDYPAIRNQGNLGACTAFAALRMVNLLMKRDKNTLRRDTLFQPAEMFTYYVTRVMEDSVEYDCGAQIRTAIKSLVKYGVSPEAECAYQEGLYAHKPKDSAFILAEKNQAINYFSVPQKASQIESVIAGGNFVEFGISCYENTFDLNSEFVAPLPLPDSKDDGGHAITIVDYNRGKRLFRIANSWGDKWGDKGHFWLPYDYVLNPDLSCDFWTVIKIEDGK